MILYASKYGSTREYAEALARLLGVSSIPVEKVEGELLASQPYFILGSPIYGFSVLPGMNRFIEENRELLKRIPVAAFVVCGDTTWNPKAGEGGPKNLDKLAGLLPSTPFATAVFGGRMRMEELDERDRASILAFYRRIGREPTGFNRMELDKVGVFADEIRRVLFESQP